MSEALVDPRQHEAPKVNALLRHFDNEVVEELDQPGDVVRRTVTLRVPARRSGEHGANCATCMKEALYAEQQTKLGKTPKQIRAAINEDRVQNRTM